MLGISPDFAALGRGIFRGSEKWWALRDSNPRPTRCKRDALTTAPSAQPGHTVGGAGHFDKAQSENVIYSCSYAAFSSSISNPCLNFQGRTLCLHLRMQKARRTWNSFEEMRKAAEEGDPQAQCYLGVCYQNGQGIQQDYHEAVKWFRKSADQN